MKDGCGEDTQYDDDHLAPTASNEEPENQSSESDDRNSNTHVDICRETPLREEGTRKSNNSVCQSKTQKRVLALRGPKIVSQQRVLANCSRSQSPNTSSEHHKASDCSGADYY